MTENARNIAVGLVALVAMFIVVGMILVFVGMPGFAKSGYELKLNFPATADAHPGDPVHLAGIRVGSIQSIAFDQGDPRRGVIFNVQIDQDVRIPGDVGAYIYTRGLAGGAYVQLAPGADPWIDPRTGKTVEFLPTDGSVVLHGELKTGMIPDDIKAGLECFSRLADRLNEMLGAGPGTAQTPPADTQPAGQPSLKAMLVKIDTALDGINSTVNTENRENLRKTLANLAKASGDVQTTLGEANKTLIEIRTTATRTGDSVEAVSKKFVGSAERLSTMLDRLDRTVTKINSGQGTAAKLLNDPQLYNNLVEASDQLAKLAAELREMIATWKAQGVKVELK